MTKARRLWLLLLAAAALSGLLLLRATTGGTIPEPAGSGPVESRGPIAAIRPADAGVPDDPDSEQPTARSPLGGAAELHPQRAIPGGNRLKCVAHLPARASDDPTLAVRVRVASTSSTLLAQSDGSWTAVVDVPEATIALAHPIQLFVESARYCHVALALPVSRNLVREGTAHFAVELRDATRAEVRVEDDGGAPAAGCEIWLNHDAPERCGRGAVTTRKLVTGADGRGELLGLEPGRWTWALADAKWWSAPEPGALVAQLGDPAFERIVVPRKDEAQYASGRFLLGAGSTGDCPALAFDGVADRPGAAIPIAAGGEFYLDLAAGESADVRIVDPCSKRRSKLVRIDGGTHGAAHAVVWE